MLVHPDKNPGDEARAAFEALNETHRMLKDPSRLVSVESTASYKLTSRSQVLPASVSEFCSRGRHGTMLGSR